MRINKFVALATGLSRRTADQAILAGRVTINQTPAHLGDLVEPNDHVSLDQKIINIKEALMTILLNKPESYVCSRNGQGSLTVYDLLPKNYHHLKPVGRLDKDSSGLLLLTNDGGLANKLTHPRYQKLKVYKVKLNKPLTLADKHKCLTGVMLEDGLSKFIDVKKCSEDSVEIKMIEGRNRQIRRTFAALGYQVNSLHRTAFGPYKLGSLKFGNWQEIKPN